MRMVYSWWRCVSCFRTVQLPKFQERLEGYDSRYRGESGAVKVAENFPPMEEVDDFLRPKNTGEDIGLEGFRDGICWMFWWV